MALYTRIVLEAQTRRAQMTPTLIVNTALVNRTILLTCDSHPGVLLIQIMKMESNSLRLDGKIEPLSSAAVASRDH